MSSKSLVFPGFAAFVLSVVFERRGCLKVASDVYTTLNRDIIKVLTENDQDADLDVIYIFCCNRSK